MAVTLSVTLYFVAPGAPEGTPGGPPIGPPGPASTGPPPGLSLLTKPQVRATRSCMFVLLGPRAKFLAICGIPDAGSRSKHPNWVAYRNVPLAQDAAGTFRSAGLCTAAPSPDGSSRPVVM